MPIFDLYVVIHTHRHGTDVRLVRADHQPLEEEVIKAFDIDFEPERDEYLEIDFVSQDGAVLTLPTVGEPDVAVMEVQS